jgi:hypothetical protein
MPIRKDGDVVSAGGGATIEAGGTAVAGAQEELNFTGAGVVVTQDGSNSNQVNVAIAGGSDAGQVWLLSQFFGS